MIEVLHTHTGTNTHNDKHCAPSPSPTSSRPPTAHHHVYMYIHIFLPFGGGRCLIEKNMSGFPTWPLHALGSLFEYEWMTAPWRLFVASGCGSCWSAFCSVQFFLVFALEKIFMG